MKKKEAETETSKKNKDLSTDQSKINKDDYNTDRPLIREDVPIERRKVRKFIVPDEDKVKQIGRLYSGLEFKKDYSDTDNANYGQMDAVSSATRGILNSAKNSFLEKLFYINQLLLQNQVVSEGAYQVIMFLEFLQILFYIFYKVTIRNEFKQISVQTLGNSSVFLSFQGNDSQINNITNDNQTFDYYEIYASALTSDDSIANVQLTSIYQFFEFMNFPLYFMKPHDLSTFDIIYDLLIIFFFTLVIILGLTIYRLSQSGDGSGGVRMGDVPEGMKYVLKILSFGVKLEVSLIEIPMMCILVQRFTCNEDLIASEYSLNGVVCEENNYKALFGISAVILIIYLGFLMIQFQLYSSQNFKSEFPWSGLQRDVPFVRSLMKLILVCGFIFCKGSTQMVQAYFSLACIPLSIYVVSKRLTRVVYFRIRVQYMATFYDMAIALLLIVISIHIIVTKEDASNALSIATLIIIVMLAALLSAIGLYIQQLKLERETFRTFSGPDERNKQDLLQTKRQIMNPQDLELYFLCLYQLIERNNQEDHLKLHSILSSHALTCSQPLCKCNQVLHKVDSLKVLERRQRDYQEYFGKGVECMEEKTATAADMVDSEYFGNTLVNIMDRQAKGYRNRRSTRQFSGTNQTSQTGASFKSRQPILTQQDLDFIEQVERDEQENLYNEKKAQKAFFVFMAQLLRNHLDNSSKTLTFRLIHANILKDKLGNNFKACFEVLSCANHDPELKQRFQIFRLRMELEEAFILSQKNQDNKQGVINISHVYEYERLYSKYLFKEYQVTHASLGFWRELMQKNLDGSQINKKGTQISRSYHQIQDIAADLQKRSPNDIKFMFRYGLFLLKVINSEQDAFELLKRIQLMYELKTAKKSASNNSQTFTEQQIYGENTASAIILISASAREIGKIIHTNEEVEYLLGYTKNDLQGINVSNLLPYIFRVYHERLIQRYLEFGKDTILHRRRRNFAVNKEGYLVPAELMLKVFPQINGQLVFAGFLQKASSFTEMAQVSQGYEDMDQNYIITDENGYISNITEGLFYEIGLNSKFFSSKDITFLKKVMNITQLCSEISYPDVTDSFDTVNGQVLVFDTSKILDYVEIETLSSEEVLEVRSNLGIYQVYTQYAKWIIDPEFCIINVYRLIVLKRLDLNINSSTKISAQGLHELLGASLVQKSDTPHQDYETSISHNQDSMGSGLSQLQRSSSMHSFSSTSGDGSSQSIDGIIRDFKRKINERQTPKALIMLNKLILLIILGTIILTVVDYRILSQEILDLSGENEHNLNSERRTLEYTELAVNSRSWINAGMGIEFDQYYLEDLNSLDRRFELLGRFVQQQSLQLKEIHDFMTQQRVSDDAGTDELQSAFEYEKIHLYKLEQKNHVEGWDVQYRVGMYQFFNEIQNLNESTRESLKLPEDLIWHQPEDSDKIFRFNFTVDQRSAYFIIVNGLRSLRVKTREATVFQQETSFSNLAQNPFMIIMIIAILITMLSLMVVLVQIYRIEKLQSEILSLYALVSIDNIGLLYDKCADYLNTLEKCSLLSLVDLNGAQNSQFLRIQSTIQQKMHLNKRGGNRKKKEDGEISEEEKETQIYREYLESKFRQAHQAKKILKNSQKRQTAINSSKSEVDPENLGKNLYAQIIRKTCREIKAHNTFQQEVLLNHENNQNDKTQVVQNPKDVKIHKSDNQPIKNKRRNHLERTFDIKVQNDDEVSVSLSGDESSTESKEGDPKNIKRRKHRQPEKLQRLPSIKDQMESFSADSIEERKKAFKNSMRSQNKGLKIWNILITFVFCSYFIVTYLFHEYYKDDLQLLQTSIPLFFNRYRYLFLSMALLRERIIFNNSLTTFESYPGYGFNADQYFNDQSILNDQLLKNIKVKKPKILQKMIDFLLASDSPDFCSSIIGQKSFFDEETDDSELQLKGRSVRTNKYQPQINTVIRACNAAFDGDVKQLQMLRQMGINLNQQDYNGLTPLYYAIRGNQTAVIEYLLRINVNLNPVDRWGGTPLNYVRPGSALERQLIQRGARRGKNQPNLQPPVRMNLTENDYRLLYAASRGDLATIEILKFTGQRKNLYDIESRTPLHLAACSGNQDTVEYLVKNGADIMKKDSRGVDPVKDAILAGFQQIHEYLDSVMSESIVKKNCKTFAEGLFSQGVQSAIGSFRKKFGDLQILVNQTTSYPRRMTLLFGERYSKTRNPLNQTTLKTYFQAQELYLSRVIEYMVTSMQETYKEHSNLYIQQKDIIFAIFITIQVLILVWLRSLMISKMKREVFENRGILNLIPGHVFDQNKQEVEALIKKIKD